MCYTTNWAIVKKAHPWIYSSRKYDFYLSEKLLIATANSGSLLIKRNEHIVSAYEQFCSEVFKNKLYLLFLWAY